MPQAGAGSCTRRQQTHHSASHIKSSHHETLRSPLYPSRSTLQRSLRFGQLRQTLQLEPSCLVRSFASVHLFVKAASSPQQRSDKTFFTTCHPPPWRWPGRKSCLVLCVGLQVSLDFGTGNYFGSELLFYTRLQPLIYFRERKPLCFSSLNAKHSNVSALKTCVHMAHRGRGWKKVQKFEHPCLRQSSTKRK